jgi:predicted Zn-dependent peptidase
VDLAVRRTVLPGGLRVVSERIPGSRSVAFGIWVGVGSRDERPSTAGAAHFLEHALFKGTRRRDAMAIASALDAVGGELNAFTAKEYTCFHARVLDEDLPLAVDVVCDLVTSSLLRTADVEVERGVILEEIAMNEDDPGDAVHDVFAGAVFGDSPLGRPVIGTVESISAMTRTALAGFYRRHYDVPNMVVAAAGAVDHEQLVSLLEQALGDRLGGEAAPAGPRPTAPGPRTSGGVVAQDGLGEQAHLVLGTTGLRRDDPRRFALGVLSTALGGGMSSRLFQTVREERGLAYSVYSSCSSSADTGLFGVYAGCSPGKVGAVLGLVREAFDSVAESGIADEEVTRAKGAMRGSLVLDLEDTDARMSRLGLAEVTSGRLLSVDDELARIAAVTPDDVREIARDVLTRPLSLGVLGPVGRTDLEKALS